MKMKISWCLFSIRPRGSSSPVKSSACLTSAKLLFWEDDLEEMQEISAGFSIWFTYFWLKRKKNRCTREPKDQGRARPQCLKAEQQRRARLVRGPPQVSENEDENPSFYQPWNIFFFNPEGSPAVHTHTSPGSTGKLGYEHGVLKIMLNFCSWLREILK